MGQTEKTFLMKLYVDVFMVANYVSYPHFPINPVIRSDQGGSRNLFSVKNANTDSHVTLVFDEYQSICQG